jgi:hypothetical protein
MEPMFISWTHPGAGRTSNRVWVASVATLLGMGGALWLWRARAQAALGSAATSATMAARVETHAAQVVVPPSAQANATATPAASEPVVGGAPSASATALVGARSRPSTPPRQAEPATRSAPKPAANCDPPYSIDSSGRRIFKLECM